MDSTEETNEKAPGFRDLIGKALKDPAVRYAAIGGAAGGGLLVVLVFSFLGFPGIGLESKGSPQAVVQQPYKPTPKPEATYLGPEGGSVEVRSMATIDQARTPAEQTPPEAESVAPAAEKAARLRREVPPKPAASRDTDDETQVPGTGGGSEYTPDQSPQSTPQSAEAPPEPTETSNLPPAPPVKLDGKPRIAIVIDDVGVDKRRSARAGRLPAKVTLSFLPYARDLAEQAAAARNGGHEIMLHVAMEPESAEVDPGPNVLLTGAPESDLQKSLEWNLSQLSGYAGVNNHMGSRFTRDLPSMRVVMRTLKDRGLFFLDSLTSRDSVGARAAREAGVPFLARDVFIDHRDDAAVVAKQLSRIERLARKKGLAIAIGHPRDITLDALEAWLPGLEGKGFRLIGLSEALAPPPATAQPVARAGTSG